MCYFITIAVPESSIDVLSKEAGREMSAWLCENPYIMSHVPPGYCGCVLTTGMCSCDLYRSPLDHETPERTASRLRKKYKQKGWSDAKIERALADAVASQESVRGLRADALSLIGRIADTLRQVYVFVHMYHGDQTTEEAVVKHGPTVQSDDFASGRYILEPDVLVTVKGQN